MTSNTNGFDLDKVGKEIGDGLAVSSTAANKADIAKEASQKAKSKAYETAHNVMESLGLSRQAKSAREYVKDASYVKLYNAIGTAISKQLNETIGETRKNGTIIFEDRVSKQISRMATAYRERNDSGTQSAADVENKRIAKERNEVRKDMAALLSSIVSARMDENDAAVEQLLKQAVMRFSNT